MEKVKVALAADTYAVQKTIINILGVNAQVNVLEGCTPQALLAGMAEADVLVLAGTDPHFWKNGSALLAAAADARLPVICVAGENEKSLLAQAKTADSSWIQLADASETRSHALMEKELLVKVKSCYGMSERRNVAREKPPSPALIGVGASTGGPKALLTVLSDLPENTCGILVVQHLSAGFSGNFAQYLDQKCKMHAKQAAAGEIVRRGNIYLAPENCQMTVVKRGEEFVLQVTENRRQYDFCPSVDCLFESIADCGGEKTMGVILTGMGNDGAKGILKMRQNGAHTICQDAETSDIYSMPREAMLGGGVVKQLPLGEIEKEIELFCRRISLESGRI